MISRVRIGDLGEVITGNTPPRNKPEYYGSHTPFIKATDIDESSKYTYSPEESYSEVGYKKYRKSLIPKGSTCVVTIGSIGKKMTMAHCDCFINQAMNAIIPSADYDPEYVYYVVKNNVHRLKSLDSGTASGRENVSKSAFSNLEIDVIDDIGTQKRIGSVLSNYDDLIENNQKQIKLLEEAAQRLYKEWFVDLRFPGHETTPIVDGVPEGWTSMAMNDIAEYINGYAFKPSDWGTKGKPIIKIKEMGSGITADTPRNRGEGIPAKYIVTAGDILFSWSATLSAMIWDEEDGLLNQHLFKVIPHNGISREFILQSILKALDEFSNLTTGSTMKHIQRGKLKEVFVNVPDNVTMRKYEFISEPMREQILTLKKQIILLKEARDRLLPKLMNGEIEV